MESHTTDEILIQIALFMLSIWLYEKILSSGTEIIYVNII